MDLSEKTYDKLFSNVTVAIMDCVSKELCPPLFIAVFIARVKNPCLKIHGFSFLRKVRKKLDSGRANAAALFYIGRSNVKIGIL